MLFYRKIRSPKPADQVMTSERNTRIRKMASSPATDIQVLGKDKRKEKPQIYLTVSFKTMSRDFISCIHNILYFRRSDLVCCWSSNEYLFWSCL